MSLISDALRKAESVSPARSAPPASPRFPTKAVFAVGVGLLLAGAGWAAAKRSEGKPSFASAAAPTKTAARPLEGFRLARQADSSLRLNGILRGNAGKQLALINNQVVPEGGTIQGERIVRVEPDRVDLEREDGTVNTLKLAN